MSKHYVVAEPACYVTVPGVGAVLLYREAPVPDSAENLEQLEADGFIVEVAEEEAGGQQSDIPPHLESPGEPLPLVVAVGEEEAKKYAKEQERAARDARAERDAEASGASPRAASRAPSTAERAEAEAAAKAEAKAAAEQQHAARRAPEKGGA